MLELPGAENKRAKGLFWLTQLAISPPLTRGEKVLKFFRIWAEVIGRRGEIYRPILMLCEFDAMTSPYLKNRLRSHDEAVEDKVLRDLRHRHKKIALANKEAELKQAENVFRLGSRLITKFGAKS